MSWSDQRLKNVIVNFLALKKKHGIVAERLWFVTTPMNVRSILKYFGNENKTIQQTEAVDPSGDVTSIVKFFAELTNWTSCENGNFSNIWVSTELLWEHLLPGNCSPAMLLVLLVWITYQITWCDKQNYFVARTCSKMSANEKNGDNWVFGNQDDCSDKFVWQNYQCLILVLLEVTGNLL